MAQDSWPSPNHNSRNVTDSEYERIAARFSDDGILGSPADAAVVTAGTGLQVLIKAGNTGSLRGHAWTSGTTDVPLTISENASGLTRIDRVVLRLDRATWDVRAVVKEGTPGASAPALTQDAFDTGAFEMQLARVTVLNGAASVTVTRGELYVGSRVRVCKSTDPNLFPQRGEIQYETDTGKWRGYNGSSRVTIHEDTGRLDLLPGFDTWEPVFRCFGRREGEVVRLRLWYRRLGSTFSASDSDGSKLAVLPGTLISTHNEAFGGVFSSAQTCQVQVRNDGEVWATNLNKDVAVNSTLFVSCTYIRETD